MGGFEGKSPDSGLFEQSLNNLLRATYRSSFIIHRSFKFGNGFPNLSYFFVLFNLSYRYIPENFVSL